MKYYDIPLDRITYNVMIYGFVKGSEGDDDDFIESTIVLLDSMIHQCELNTRITPDALTFTKVLNAIAKSRIAENADPARKVFYEMISLHEARMDDKTFLSFSLCLRQSR